MRWTATKEARLLACKTLGEVKEAFPKENSRTLWKKRKEIINSYEHPEPKILYYDIETAPNLGYIWGKYEQNVLDYEHERYILCFAYRWEGDRRVQTVSLPDFKTTYRKDPQDDKKVVGALWTLLNEADVVVAHNGDSFDQPLAHARFIYHSMGPPQPYRQVDTRKVAKKYFNFNSNKLNDLGEHLGLGRKVETGGWKLWKDVISDNKTAWRKMLRYNKQDVVLLENVYKKMLPWIDNHPNLSLITGEIDSCPKCGDGPMEKGEVKIRKSSVVRTYRCKTCGGYSDARVADKSRPKANYV